MVRVEVAGVRHRFDTTRTRAFARSSPARLVALGLLLLALCLIAGTIIADDIGNRQRGLADLLAEAEPDANSAQDLYTSLSVADAAAGTAFISGGLEPAAVRDRYTQAIGQAAAELAARSETGSGSAASGSDAALRTRMATELPVYTGLIETARTNNREGHPVGAAYLSEASNVMQTTLLPAARQFQQHRSAAITDGRLGPTVPPWMAIILPVLTLATLVAAQVYLARHWHRLLNPGMLAASAIVAILLIWVVTAGSISALSAADGRDRGAVPTTALAQGRILAQQARTAETLKLVRRDYSAGYDTTFEDGVTGLDRLLTQYPHDAPGTGDTATAATALGRWKSAHQRMNDALSRGDFQSAKNAAIGTNPDTAESATQALDGALAAGISKTRNTLRDNISESERALNLLVPGAVVLAVLAAMCVVAGLWPRLREYR